MIDYVQVYARSVEKCFTREATAIDSCPTDREVFYLEIEDFLLYSKFTVKMTSSYSVSHRRRIYTEEKAKVVAAVWGTEFIPFLCRASCFVTG